MTKSIICSLIVLATMENLATLQEIHGATRDMRPEIAIAGLGAPLHAGALRYYREVGLEIPERLLLEWRHGSTTSNT